MRLRSNAVPRLRPGCPWPQSPVHARQAKLRTCEAHVQSRQLQIDLAKEDKFEISAVQRSKRLTRILRNFRANLVANAFIRSCLR